MVIARCLVVAMRTLVQGQRSKLPVRGGSEAWPHCSHPLANRTTFLRDASVLCQVLVSGAMMLPHGAPFGVRPASVTGPDSSALPVVHMQAKPPSPGHACQMGEVGHGGPPAPASTCVPGHSSSPCGGELCSPSSLPSLVTIYTQGPRVPSCPRPL